MTLRGEDALAYFEQLHQDLTDLTAQVARLASVAEDIAAILAHGHNYDLADHLRRKPGPA